MKVHELIEKLKSFDPNLEVFGYSEDTPLLAKGHSIRLLDINTATLTEGETCRTDDRTPSIKFGTHQHSRKLVILEMTCDF